MDFVYQLFRGFDFYLYFTTLAITRNTGFSPLLEDGDDKDERV